MMNSLLLMLKPWIAWLHLHPYGVGAVTFLIAFIECLAVVGLLVPGTVIMTAIGALIGSGVISAHMVFIPAILGAILGDVLSFLLGFHYREGLRDMWPFKFYPRLLQRGESFFYRHGGKGIFAGRFLGPIRPMLPLIAGMLNMPRWRFFLADSISAVFWAPLYMLPGILLGAASVELAPDIAMHLMLYVILILLILWCISWLIKRFVAWLFNTLHTALDKLWTVIKHKPFLQPLHIALQDPLHPESHAQLTLGLYFIFFSMIFMLTAWSVSHHGVLTLWNHELLFFLRSLKNPQADHIFISLTLLGAPKVITGVFGVLLLWFLGIRAFRTAGHWALLGILSVSSVEMFKYLTHSPRPWGLWVIPHGYSFPSGHTALSAVLAGFMAVLISRQLKNTQRWIPYTVAVFFVLAVAASRLYLGAHWLTDVIGAMLLALSLVMLVTLSYRRLPTPQLKLLPLCLVLITSWASFAAIYGTQHYHKMLKDYRIIVPLRELSLTTWWEHDGIDEPLYRLNRTGKPTQVLNIQWASNLDTIEQTLLSQGWEVFSNTTFNAILTRFGQQKKQITLPVLPQLYLEQRPVLVMTKQLSSPDSLLVLSLWDSKTLFTNTATPLWLGNITYFHIWQTGFFHLHPPKIILPPQPAIDIFKTALGNYMWKQLSYPFSAENTFTKLEWDGQIILIKPKNEEMP